MGKLNVFSGKFRRSAAVVVLTVVVSPLALIIFGRWLDPPVTAFMVERYVHAWMEGDWRYTQDHDWVDWRNISRNMPLAVMASEDQRFPDHHGFDWVQMQKAVEDWQDGDRLRGASTISQQLAKNLFLWSGQNWLRKGLEVPLTFALETFWSKQRILEVYLNVVEFGDGVYGVEAASLSYFRKHAAQLSMSEAARLAAVLPNPKRFIADRPSSYVRERQRWIEGQMNNLGYDYLKRL